LNSANETRSDDDGPSATIAGGAADADGGRSAESSEKAGADVCAETAALAWASDAAEAAERTRAAAEFPASLSAVARARDSQAAFSRSPSAFQRAPRIAATSVTLLESCGCCASTADRSALLKSMKPLIGRSLRGSFGSRALFSFGRVGSALVEPSFGMFLDGPVTPVTA
jgi:hypothetical protein